jgi:hypothetical protein
MGADGGRQGRRAGTAELLAFAEAHAREARHCTSQASRWVAGRAVRVRSAGLAQGRAAEAPDGLRVEWEEDAGPKGKAPGQGRGLDVNARICGLRPGRMARGRRNRAAFTVLMIPQPTSRTPPCQRFPE